MLPASMTTPKSSALIDALLKDASNEQLALDLARCVAAAGGDRDPRFTYDVVRRALTSAWWNNPREPSLWPLVIEPFGIQVKRNWSEPAAAFWVENHRAADEDGLLFDTKSGLPLVYQRSSDSAIMHLVHLPNGDYVLIDRWPVGKKSFHSAGIERPTTSGGAGSEFPGLLGSVVRGIRSLVGQPGANDSQRPADEFACNLTAQAIWRYTRRVKADLPTYSEWNFASRLDGPWKGRSPFDLQDMAGTVIEMLDDVRLSNDEDDPGSNKAWVKVATSPEGAYEDYRYTQGKPLKRLGFRCVKRLSLLQRYIGGGEWPTEPSRI